MSNALFFSTEILYTYLLWLNDLRSSGEIMVINTSNLKNTLGQCFKTPTLKCFASLSLFYFLSKC